MVDVATVTGPRTGSNFSDAVPDGASFEDKPPLSITSSALHARLTRIRGHGGASMRRQTWSMMQTVCMLVARHGTTYESMRFCFNRVSADVGWHCGHGVLQGFVAAVCKQSLFQHSSRGPATAGYNGHNRTSTCDLGDHARTTVAPSTGEGNASGRPERHNPCDISHIAPPSFRSRPLRAR